MKSDLIWGWIFVALALLMVFCIVYGCFIGNWAALPMCSFALILDIVNAINRFSEYKSRKRHEDMYSIMSMRCWSDYDEDEPEDNSIITD